MMANQKNKVTFIYEENDNQYGHDLRMQYTIDPDASIWELHDMCKRFMIAMGFAEKTVEEAFGESVFDD